jgi:hypothetical protein
LLRAPCAVPAELPIQAFQAVILIDMTPFLQAISTGNMSFTGARKKIVKEGGQEPDELEEQVAQVRKTSYIKHGEG